MADDRVERSNFESTIDNENIHQKRGEERREKSEKVPPNSTERCSVLLCDHESLRAMSVIPPDRYREDRGAESLSVWRNVFRSVTALLPSLDGTPFDKPACSGVAIYVPDLEIVSVRIRRDMTTQVPRCNIHLREIERHRFDATAKFDFYERQSASRLRSHPTVRGAESGTLGVG
jgi:hypothetical protein